MGTSARRRPRAERREQIAWAALDIIGRRGLPELTIATLAREIGVTPGALYRHFATREEILEESVVQAAARMEATFPDASLPPVERLRALALARIELISSEPGIAWLLRSNQAPLSLPPPAVTRLRTFIARSRRYILEAMKDARQARELRADVPIEFLLLLFTATIHALIGQPVTLAQASGRRKPRDAVQHLLRTLAPARPAVTPQPAPIAPRAKRVPPSDTRSNLLD